MKMEQTECSETSAYKIQTPGNYPKESIRHTEHGESLKLGNDISYPCYVGPPATILWEAEETMLLSIMYRQTAYHSVGALFS